MLQRIFIESDKPSKICVVLVHGNSCSASSFDKVIPKLKEHYHVMTMELPGHGQNNSSETTDFNYQPTSIKRRLLQEINQIEYDTFIYAHSLGGHMILDIVNEINVLKGLMVYGTPPIKKPLNMEEAFGDFPEMGYYFTPETADSELHKMFVKLVQNELVIDKIFNDFRDSDPLFRAILASSLDQFEDEHEIALKLNIPLGLWYGESDPSMNPEYLEQFNSNSYISVESIPACGHFPHLEDPKSLNGLIINFIQRHLA